MSETIVAYKGFDKDLKCRGFQYEIGKEYEEPDAAACEKGFHACEMPLDVLGYYEPGKQSRYCVVEQSGVISKRNDDSKVASSKIKIGAEIGIPGLVKAQIEYVREKTEPSGKHHTTGSRSANSATGSRSANSATGDWSANSATGYGSANSATGSRSANSATGYGSVNSATGYGSANISTGIECSNNAAGDRNISVAWGKDNKCKGAIGCFLVMSEWGDWDGHKYPFIGAKMVEVDGKAYKPDTWYTLKNGEIVKVD
ncbi:MAG: hypothetical protein U0N82_12090 [Oscillospiraceae bacterium]